MSPRSLPLRIAYAAVATPLGWAAGFYSCIDVLPRYATRHPGLDPNLDGSGIFRIAVCAGAAVALTFFLVALTLPWVRHRKKAGRPPRIAVSSALVLVGSLLFADLGFRLVYDLLFAAWLSYTLAFTVVRYGVRDEVRRRSRRRHHRRPYLESRSAQVD